MATNFEDIPNEIILQEIYSYFSLKELYRTFYDLNQRFRDIIRLTTYLKFEVNNETINDQILTVFQSTIAHLTICFGNFDINRFTNVRVLILKYPSLKQRNAIRPEILPYLTSLKLSYPIEDKDLLNIIFSGRFPHLRKCEFDRILTDDKWSGAPEFRSVSVSVSGKYGIISLLRACPNLSRLTIIVYPEMETNSILLKYSISCPNHFTQLQYLFIRSSFDIFIGILKLMSNLKSLIFDDISNGSYFDYTIDHFKSLKGILQNFHQLSYIRFTFNGLLDILKDSLLSIHSLLRYISPVCFSICTVISSHPISNDHNNF